MCKDRKKSNHKDEYLLKLVETSILPLYNLENAKIEQIKIKHTEKHRAVYKISLQDKIYCLKKVYYSEENLLFVYSAVQWLFKKGFKVPNFIFNINGEPFVSVDNLLFILTPWLEGTKCNFDAQHCLENTLKTLAIFHENTRNFKPIEGSYIRENFDNLYISTNKHFIKLLECFNEAQKRKDKFSKLFLKNFDDNIELAKFSLEISSTINFKNLSRSLCHGDYVNKNLICKDNDICIIDFDKCSINYSIFDLSYFFRRLLKRRGSTWDLETAKKALLAYNKYSKCTKDDIKYLLAYISFPQKYWRISKDYFNNVKKCNKHTFLDMLSNNSKTVCLQKKFVSDFYEFCVETFDI